MSSLHLLVVDDDKGVRDFLADFLSSIGFCVSVCESADAAMKMPKHELVRFDVVMTDYEMPGIDGIQFARYVQLINPAVQIIVMSGMVEQISDHVTQIGTTLKKPFSLPSLINRLPDPISTRNRVTNEPFEK